MMPPVCQPAKEAPRFQSLLLSSCDDNISTKGPQDY